MIVFRICGVAVCLHPSLFLLILLLSLAGYSRYVLLSAGFSVLHEFAHGAAARGLGYTPERVTAGLFGGVLYLREQVIKPCDQLMLTLAGPFFNLLTAALTWRLLREQGMPWLEDIMLVNLLLGLFNLLPFYPLDGGKILNLYLACFFGYGVAGRLSRFFSLLFSLLLFFLGIYLLQYSILNILISALAVNLYLAFRQERPYQYDRVRRAYNAIQKELGK